MQQSKDSVSPVCGIFKNLYEAIEAAQIIKSFSIYIPTFVSENPSVIQVCSDSFLCVETFPIVVWAWHSSDILLNNFPDSNIREFP